MITSVESVPVLGRRVLRRSNSTAGMLGAEAMYSCVAKCNRCLFHAPAGAFVMVLIGSRWPDLTDV